MNFKQLWLVQDLSVANREQRENQEMSLLMQVATRFQGWRPRSLINHPKLKKKKLMVDEGKHGSNDRDS